MCATGSCSRRRNATSTPKSNGSTTATPTANPAVRRRNSPYTILAASLAYQFGLEWGVEQSRDFRFAVIDEAFGRGSDVSTRYALDLFATLGLQLLIVTPLQKVHVIEPYVKSIGMVDNPTGTYSRLHTMTIEEYRNRRDGPRT
jgi:uncharacterized protein YPO0396